MAYPPGYATYTNSVSGQQKIKNQSLNKLFEKYRPSIEKILDKGKYLSPITDNVVSHSVFEMEEHKTNIYGDIITGLIIAEFIIFLLISEIEMNGNEIAFYCFIAFMSLGSIVLTFNGINKISNPINKGCLSVNSDRIRHYDAIKSKSRTIKWTEIKDVVLKLYRHKNGYDKYLLILNKEDKVIGLDITYLYDKSKKSILKDDFKNIAKMEMPEYIELRMILGKHLNEQRKPNR